MHDTDASAGGHPHENGDPVLVEVRDRVAVLTLNRPQARNSLSTDMMTALDAALDRIGADQAVNAVVLRAEGPGFCAGHDLKEMQAHRNDADRGAAFFRALFDQCTALMGRIQALPVPVIAAVQGSAVAAGCQLVATCDMAIASKAARFGVNGIDVGFFCSTPAVALSRNVGRKKTMELLVTGRMMGAEEALGEGLVNHVVAADELDAAALALAGRIAEKSRAVIALGKATFTKQVQMPLEEAYALACQTMVDNLMMRDSEEGFAAFLEKRKPEWRGE
jgi:enoyl-CoA hydratase/carnithine racemase